VSEPRVEQHLPLSGLPSTRPFLALWGGLAVVDLGRVAGTTFTWQFAAVTLLALACSVGVARAEAVCVAGICWLVVNGFVVHDLGQLGFSGSGDVVRAVILLAAALAAGTVHR
jgi:hypothetical protein